MESEVGSTPAIRTKKRAQVPTPASDAAFEDLGQSVSYLLRRAEREVTRQFIERLNPSLGVRPGTLSILILASASPGIDQNHIAQQLSLDKANVASLIRALDAAGWLVRKRPEQDRRRQGVFLTPAGVRELAKLKRELRLFDHSLCSAYSDEERMLLVLLLRKICFPDGAES